MSRCRLSTGVKIALLVPVIALLGAESTVAAEKPGVLVHAVRGQHNGGVDLGWLKDLQASGFEVDYTDLHGHFTWERIRQYNCLVLVTCPAPTADQTHESRILKPPFRKEFLALVDRFLQQGGGVLAVPLVKNVRHQVIRPVIERWDAKVPMETIDDPDNMAPMSQMSRPRLCFTDQVLPSPVSAGVKQIWFPNGRFYNAGYTSPLVLGDEWTVIVRASKTAKSKPFKAGRTGFVPPTGLYSRPEGVASPAIFAIRPVGNGRVALCAMLPQFSIRQGTQWLYNRDVLSRGAAGKPSHFGRLLENSLRWLAEPSLKSGKLGGYQTDPDRLKLLNYRPEIVKRFHDWLWSDQAMQLHRPPKGPVFKGLIGVQTELGGATGSVAEYAKVARECGLDFIALMDDFRKLTPEKLAEMQRQCAAASDEKLLVLPGYTIDNNIGNHLFIFGTCPPWPPKPCLTGPNGTLLNQQYQDADGKFTREISVLNWLLRDVYHAGNQIGFYHFSANDAPGGGKGMGMEDLRTFGMAAVWFYRDGKLVEDRLADYLLTAQGYVPPSPSAVNRVRSPAELRREATAKRGLTYGQARRLKTLFDDALLYPHQYLAPNVFPSSGPIILAWPECYRIHTLATEDFVTGRNAMRSTIHVTSDVGLKEVRILNGQQLFRRIALGGRKEYRETLILNGSVHKNMVLIAEDVKGGQAISFCRICRKVGDTFEDCGDRVNDCGDVLLAHGPMFMRVMLTPKIYGGFTWDGGPKGERPLMSLAGSQPVVVAEEGQEGRRLFNQTPILEFTDEGARVVRQIRNVAVRDDVPTVNPWATYGPLVPSKLFEHTQRFAQWHAAVKEVHPTGHAGYSYPYGAIPTEFTTWLRFKRDLTVKRMELFSSWHAAKDLPQQMVIRAGGKLQRVDLTALKKRRDVRLAPGDCFGVCSPKTANAHIVFVRGVPMRMSFTRPQSLSPMLLADLPDKQVKADQRLRYGVATYSFPLDAPINAPEDLEKSIAYIESPTGLVVTGAKRVSSPGLLDYEATADAVRIQIPRATWKTFLTLPIRVKGYSRKWTCGLWLKEGFVKGFYGPPTNRFRPMGVDFDGQIYVPISPDLAEKHDVVVGHPIVADAAGKDVFIQVTQTSGGVRTLDGKPTAWRWHVSLNNPLAKPVTVTFKQTMPLPGLAFGTRKLTLQPGEYRVIFTGLKER